jgi:hypothetical protein
MTQNLSRIKLVLQQWRLGGKRSIERVIRLNGPTAVSTTDDLHLLSVVETWRRTSSSTPVVPNLFVHMDTFESLWDRGGHQPINKAKFSFLWTNKIWTPNNTQHNTTFNDTMVLHRLTKKDFQGCFQAWQRRWDRCVHSQGSYFEGDGWI